MSIHRTAVISTEAEISETAEIGAYAVVDGRAQIGDGCRILPHAHIVGEVTLGAGTSVGRGAVIGEDPQDLSFRPEIRSSVEIGRETVIREHVTIHRGGGTGRITRIGDRNYLMVGSHLGHDVQMGDDNVLANGVLIAGHCELGNGIFMGGGAVVHQFVRIGDFAMIQGNGSFSLDVPPYTIAGRINSLYGLNVIGLRRAGLDRNIRKSLKRAYDQMFRTDKRRGEILEHIEVTDDEVGRFFDFFRNSSKKGVCASVAR